MELLNTNRKSQVRSKFGPGRKDTGCTALARSRLGSRTRRLTTTGSGTSVQRPPNRFRAYALLCRAGPRAAAAWFRRTCLASDPRAPAGRPAADAPIRDPKFLRKYACACVDVRHRRRFPGRREQDDERAPYYALFWTPPPATGFTWAVNGEFPTLRSQQTQISRKCAHFDARRYVRGSVRI